MVIAKVVVVDKSLGPTFSQNANARNVQDNLSNTLVCRETKQLKTVQITPIGLINIVYIPARGRSRRSTIMFSCQTGILANVMIVFTCIIN